MSEKSAGKKSTRKKSAGKESAGNLKLGSAVVELLLPQRRPMLMVDFVRSFSPGPVPTLESGRHISVNEVFFEGHFPGLPMWPGAFTMEGLGQSASLLLIITLMHRRVEAEGGDPEMVLHSLRNLDRGFRLHPGFRAEDVPFLSDAVKEYRNRIAVGAAVEMKFLQTVIPGGRLDYLVEWTEDFGDLVRFTVEATADGQTVARGTLTGAQFERPVLATE